MISWIQQKLIKNGKWIFSILLIVIIVAFVFVIGNTPGIPGAERGLEGVDFYGVNIADRNALEQLDRETALAIFLDTGNPRISNDMIRQIAFSRVAMLSLANDYQIPEPTPEQIRDYLSTRPAFFNQEGRFDPDAYQTFFDNLKSNPYYPPSLVDKIVSDQYRLQEISELVQGEGFVTPYENRIQTQNEMTEWTLEVATYASTEYQPKIEITDEAIRAYYELNSFQFQTQLQQELSYAYFPRELAGEPIRRPTDEQLLDYLERNISKYMLTPQEQEERDTLPEPEELLDLRREQLLADWSADQQKEIVRRMASDFAYSLYENSVSQNSDRLQSMTEALGAQMGQLNPVARDTPPRQAGEGVTWDILQSARGLNSQQWFTDALEFRDGYGVFFLNGVIEPYIPELDEIRDQVETVYRNAETRRLLNEAGQASSAFIREQVAAGMAFRDAVERSPLGASLDVELEALNEAFQSFADSGSGQTLLETASEGDFLFTEFEDYSPISTDQGPPVIVFRAIQDLEPGDVSDMISGSGQAFFAYVKEKKIPEVDATSETYANTRNALAGFSQNLYLRNVSAELIQAGAPAEMPLP
jgi:peptidyl-prolyl cis-trans isomerase D